MQIIEGDCLTALADVAPESVHLVMTSPPYAQQRASTYGGIHPDDYGAWFLARADIWRSLLARDGSCVVVIREHAERGERHEYVYRLVLAMRAAGWRWVDEYLWCKTNPVPGKWPNRLRNGFERCYHFALAPCIKFRPEAVRRPARPRTIFQQTRLSPRDRVRQESRTGSGIGVLRAQACPAEVDPSNVLHLPTRSTNTGHPAPYPPGVPEFFIRLLTDRGDTVLDPFAGSGTTLHVAERLGRRALGVEIVPEYVRLARDGWPSP